MKFADLSMKQLAKLRKQIVLNSVFVADYRNNMDMPEHLVCAFFDGYMDFLWELEREKYGKDSDLPWDKFYDEFDNQDTLEEWYYCHEEFGDESAWEEWESMDDDEQSVYDGFAGYYESIYHG